MFSHPAKKGQSEKTLIPSRRDFLWRERAAPFSGRISQPMRKSPHCLFCALTSFCRLDPWLHSIHTWNRPTWPIENESPSGLTHWQRIIESAASSEFYTVISRLFLQFICCQFDQCFIHFLEKYSAGCPPCVFFWFFFFPPKQTPVMNEETGLTEQASYGVDASCCTGYMLSNYDYKKLRCC